MKYKYKIKTDGAFFHEEAHIYFQTQEDLDAFSKSYEKNDKWALKNKSRWNPVKSITQIFSEYSPFHGGDLTITKLWLEKELNYKGVPFEEIARLLDMVDEVETTLASSVGRSQEEGNVGHERIQDFIEQFVKEGKANGYDKTNPYWNAFLETLQDPEFTKLKEFIKNIEETLPAEIPVIGKTSDGYYYAGKWDMLVRMKDGRHILIDIKTGSNVIKDKEEKVGEQLDAYKNLIRQSMVYGEVPEIRKNVGNGDSDIDWKPVIVDELICWEISYNIIYKDLKKKLSAELKKKNQDLELIKELQDKIDEIEQNPKNVKGLREYFWKEHKFESSEEYEEIIRLTYQKAETNKLIKEKIKEKHKKEK